MKTNYVPAFTTLSAGLITCILNFKNHLSMFEFSKRLLIVLLIFYFIGSVIKLILDKTMKAFADPEENEEGQNEKNVPLENINSSNE